MLLLYIKSFAFAFYFSFASISARLCTQSKQTKSNQYDRDHGDETGAAIMRLQQQQSQQGEPFALEPTGLEHPMPQAKVPEPVPVLPDLTRDLDLEIDPDSLPPGTPTN